MRRDHALLPIVIILLGSFLLFRPVLGKVLISRIQIGGVSTTDEFVELYNFASSSQTMTAWSLKKVTAGGSVSNLVSSFPENTLLMPFSYFLVANRDYLPINEVIADINYSNNSTVLAANNSLVLYNDLGELVDRVDWGNVSTTVGLPANNPSDNKSLTRLPDNDLGNNIDSDDSSVDFIEAESLPRNSSSPSRPLVETVINENIVSTSTEIASEEIITNDELTGIVINEFVSNPESGEEWVEIYNSSSTTTDLTDATLCDSRETDSCTIKNLDGIILPSEWKIFFISGSKLNNDGDSVLLKNKFGAIVDAIDYTEDTVTQKGESLARDSDGDGEWKISLTPTPNTANIITPRPIIQSQPAATVMTGGSYWSAPLIIPKKTVTSPASIDKTTILWNINLPKTIHINSSTFFDCHLSADPRGGDILYSWNMGDGTTIDGSKIYHSFVSSGLFTLTIHATSSQGTTGKKTATIRVLNDFYNKTGVYIDSVLPKPENDSEEWVAIGSFAASSTDIGGWKINTDSGKTYTIPIKTVLKPYNLLRFKKTVTKLPLNDDGGTVFLTDPTGNIIDLLEFKKTKRGEVVNFDNFQNSITENDESTTASPTSKATSTPKKGVIKYFSSRTLAEARTLPLKSFVTVSGNVVSLPGKPYGNYFYIADETGGLQIYSYKKSFPKLNLGDKVTVYGEISSSGGVPRLKTSSAVSIKQISTGSQLSLSQKSISEIDESDYGKLLTIEGEITDILSSSFFLDDTSAEAAVAIPSGSGINKKGLRVGQTYRVIGIVEQSKDSWKIYPRSESDLLEINDVASKSQTPLSNNTKTAVGFGGGVFLVGLAAAIKKWVLKK